MVLNDRNGSQAQFAHGSRAFSPFFPQDPHPSPLITLETQVSTSDTYLCAEGAPAAALGGVLSGRAHAGAGAYAHQLTVYTRVCAPCAGVDRTTPASCKISCPLLLPDSHEAVNEKAQGSRGKPGEPSSGVRSLCPVFGFGELSLLVSEGSGAQLGVWAPGSHGIPGFCLVAPRGHLTSRPPSSRLEGM